YRHQELAKKTNADISIDKTENLIVGVVDASLAAQNMAVAAESMGLGICYIGSLRNDVKKASEILGLPDGAFPLFGMVAGYPIYKYIYLYYITSDNNSQLSGLYMISIN